MTHIKYLGQRAFLAIGVAGMVTLLAACGASGAAKAKAANSMSCPKQNLTFEGLDAGEPHYVFLASGCNKKDVVAKDTNGEYTSLRERATFELSCSTGELDMLVIDSNTFGVSGCRRKIVYKYNRLVGFVAQSASEEAPQAGGAPEADEAPVKEPAPVAAAPATPPASGGAERK